MLLEMEKSEGIPGEDYQAATLRNAYRTSDFETSKASGATGFLGEVLHTRFVPPAAADGRETGEAVGKVVSSFALTMASGCCFC